ncbi:hypothetical protein Sjap_017642 [Stephania japonica]|uniref:Uncharacterized protein n=1 Tax=Stephania japonica TaxID=461633 RepID=A0AAP0NIH1_9MAGN
MNADGDGECIGDALRAGLRGGETRYDGDLYAKIMVDSLGNGCGIDSSVCAGGTNFEAVRAEYTGGRLGREVHAVDVAGALWVCVKFSYPEVLASTEQSDAHDLDIFDCCGVSWGDELGIVYVVYWCTNAWKGLSWLAFYDLGGFIGMSIASGVMICVRVSNELGAGHPRAAKFSVWVMVSISVIIQITCTVIIIIARNQFPVLFTDDKRVIAEVSRLVFFLSASVLLSSIQPILSGLAIGAGWQTMVAYINIGSYYLVGMTVGCILAFKFNFGLEATLAKERITNWGGSAEDPLLD